jgi:hypothetical protein
MVAFSNPAPKCKACGRTKVFESPIWGGPDAWICPHGCDSDTDPPSPSVPSRPLPKELGSAEVAVPLGSTPEEIAALQEQRLGSCTRGSCGG